MDLEVHLDTLTIFLISVGLAMDAFAVSISCGFCDTGLKWRIGFRTAFTFGLFQSVMYMLGWFSGSQLTGIFSKLDHWMGFAFLSFVGGRMIYESFFSKEKRWNPRHFFILLTLAIATSIDAFGVGLSFAFLRMKMTIPALTIGVITFLLSLIGIGLGRNFGALLGKKAECLGGVILIGIGIKIVVEHLWR